MHSNLSHTSHEPSSKKKDSIKEKNRENRETKREKKRQNTYFRVVEWQTVDIVQQPRSDREQRVVSEPGAIGNNQGTGSSDEGEKQAAHDGAARVKKESKKRENRGKR